MGIRAQRVIELSPLNCSRDDAGLSLEVEVLPADPCFRRVTVVVSGDDFDVVRLAIASLQSPALSTGSWW
jgi:hypothetical protein